MNDISTPITFQVGSLYAVRSIGDHNCIWTFEVIKRTAKFVTLVERNHPSRPGQTMRVGVSVSMGREVCAPYGRYSMSPVLGADRLA